MISLAFKAYQGRMTDIVHQQVKHVTVEAFIKVAHLTEVKLWLGSQRLELDLCPCSIPEILRAGPVDKALPGCVGVNIVGRGCCGVLVSNENVEANECITFDKRIDGGGQRKDF